MSVFISIIIPVYNTAFDKLQRCIDSIDNQTYQDYEVVLVDDGSKKECAQYLDRIADHNKKFKVIHKENEGSAIARNTGILNAQSDYAMFVDADDFMTSYVLEEAAALIDRYVPDMVIGLTKKYTENDISASKAAIDPKASHIVIESNEQKETYINHILGFKSAGLDFTEGFISDGPWAKVCKTELLKKALFSRESFWNDDTIWNLNYTRLCQRMIITKNLWYACLINPYSKTRRFREHCVAEFKYRTAQELEIVTRLWPACLKGVYIRIFRDTHILCSTYLFHDQNKSTFYQKLRDYKEAVHITAYQTMLQNISFESENRFLWRVFKEAARFFALHGFDIASYFIWEIYVKSNKEIR